MKRLLTAVLALCMLLTFAACNSERGVDYSSIAEEDMGKIIAIDDPEGYEEVESNSYGTLYEKYDANGDRTHAISTYVDIASMDHREAFLSKDMDVLEEKLLAHFPEYLKVTFVQMGDYHGIRVDDTEDGYFCGVTYYLIVGEWLVLVEGAADSEAHMQEVHDDIKGMIDSIELTMMTFQ